MSMCLILLKYQKHWLGRYVKLVALILLSCMLSACSGNDEVNTTTESKGATKANKPVSRWQEIWTVVLEDERAGWRYTLQAPKGTFWFPPVADIDFDNRIVRAASATMEWHYPSGTPLHVWEEQFLPDGVSPLTPESTPYLPKDRVSISSRVDVTANPERSVRITALSHFEDRLQAGKIEDKGLVWDGKARQYEDFSNVFYQLLDRHEDDAYIIFCRSKTNVYCRIRDVVIDDYLVVENILVPMNDLANWRDYQHKAVAWIKQTIVKKEPLPGGDAL